MQLVHNSYWSFDRASSFRRLAYIKTSKVKESMVFGVIQIQSIWYDVFIQCGPCVKPLQPGRVWQHKSSTSRNG